MSRHEGEKNEWENGAIDGSVLLVEVAAAAAAVMRVVVHLPITTNDNVDGDLRMPQLPLLLYAHTRLNPYTHRFDSRTLFGAINTENSILWRRWF